MNKVDEYIAKYPDFTQKRLEQIRSIIKSEAPQLTEDLKWGDPAYSSETIMFILAGYKNHIGLHVTKTAIVALKDKLVGFKTTAGSVQFPNNNPIPIALIKEIIRYRMTEYEKQGILWK